MKGTHALITSIAVLTALLIINLIAARHPARIDLTYGNIYTLSKATKSILKNLDDVVTIRVYFTDDMPPSLQILKRGVDDLLSEFRGVAGRHIQVEFVDPNSSASEEQKAEMLGIPPVQLNVIERDKREVAKIYLGMAVMFGDKQQIIPVVKRLENLEYELAEAIIKVTSKKLPKIAWWEPGRNERPPDYTYFAIHEGLSRRYTVADVDEVNMGSLNADDFAALVLISPGDMKEGELRAIDRYLMSGGHIIFLVDRFKIGERLIATPSESKIVDLISHYGVTIDESLVLDQSNATAAFSGGPVTYHLPYAYWPDVRHDQFNNKDPVVADLETLVLPWTSPLALAKAGEGEDSNEILARTTPFAVATSGSNISLDPQSANEAILTRNRETLILAALLNGPFGSFYGNDGTAGESLGKSKILVVGSSRWASDRFLHDFPANAAFFENAVDAFAMGDILIGIRSKEDTARPIMILSDSARSFIKYTNIVAGPLIMLIIGLIVFFMRRSRRRTARLSYGG